MKINKRAQIVKSKIRPKRQSWAFAFDEFLSRSTFLKNPDRRKLKRLRREWNKSQEVAVIWRPKVYFQLGDMK